MVANSSADGETLSAKARRVLLKLDSGSVIGSADRLRVEGAAPATAVIVTADHTYSLGRLSEKDVQRMENILLQMHAKVPHAQPLRTHSSAIEGLKRKASDLYQVLALCLRSRASVALFAGARASQPQATASNHNR